VRLNPLGTSATYLAYCTSPRWQIMCGTIGGMRIGRGKRSTRRKPTPVPLSPPQIPHDLTWGRTRAAVGSQRLFAWAMARPLLITPQTRVLEKLIKFPTFHRTPRFIAAFTRAHQWTPLSQMNPVHTFPSHVLKIHFNVIFPSTTTTSNWSCSFRNPYWKFVQAFLFGSIRATCPTPTLAPLIWSF
jgi:hypothetical protein